MGGLALVVTPQVARASAPLALVPLALATAGVWSIYGPFFSWPAAWPGCDGEVAACAVAIINSLGNLGGLVGPVTVGALSRVEGGLEAEEHAHALGLLGASAVLAGLLTLLFRPTAQLWRR